MRRLCILLTLLCLLAVACTQAVPFTPPTHAGDPVVQMDIAHIMQGRFDYLDIYADGTVIYMNLSGARMALPGHPPVRTWYTGALRGAELADLLGFIQQSGFAGLPENSNYATAASPFQNQFGDTSLTIAMTTEGLQKSATATAYLTYDDMPAPLPEVYARLWAIAQGAQEAGRETLTV